MKKRLAKLDKLTYRKPSKPTASFALVSEAAKNTQYSSEYLSLLVRKGRIVGRKFGRNWYVAKNSLEKYLRERQAEQTQWQVPSYGPVVSLASVPIFPLNPITPIEGVKREERGETGQTEKPKPSDLSTDIKKELDELEELYKDKNLEARNLKPETSDYEKLQVTSYKFQDQRPRFAFPGLPEMGSRGEKGERGRAPIRLAEIAIVSVVTLVIILGGFNLKFANALYGAVKDFVQDAVSIQGHVPGTHANEILLLDKEGKISIYGHIETKGQFRSYAEQGVAPIVVDSTTTAENLSADYLDGISAQEFTLQLVTKNGNVTFNNVKLEGGVEVGKLLLVKNAAQFLDYVSVAKNLSIGGDLVANGVSTFAGKINALAGALFTGRVEVKGDVDISNFVAAQRAQIKEGGLTVSGSTQLNTLGVTGGASMSDLGISGNFSVAGKEIALGDSGADKMTVTASSTFKGPFEVTAYEAKFGKGLTVLANGLGVTGATNITGNTTVTGNLTVSGSSSWGTGLGIGTSTPGAALGVKGAGIFDGFVSANYFTSTSSLTSWIMGSMGIGTTTPNSRLGVEGDGLFKGGLYAQATTTTSSLIATSTLEVRGASGNDFVITDGNVGIATSTPGNLFSVHGNGNFQNNLTVENILKAGTLLAVTQTVSGGSTSTPAYSFNADPDTGITSGGDDNYLSLITGGAVRLGIDKSGLVGIATSSPGTQLSVKGAGLFEGFLSADYFTSTSTNTSWLMGAMGLGTTTPGARMGVRGGIISEGFVSADYFTSTSTNSSWLFGNLGVGTTTPGAKLAVGGDAFVDGFYAMGTTTTSSLIATSTLEVRGVTGNDLITWNGRVGMGSSTPNSTLTISNDGSNSTKDLLNIVNSVGTYNFVVTNGGSVGIGMYNPSGYLTVYGNTYLAATEGNVGIGTVVPNSKLHVIGDATFNFAALGDGLGDVNALGGDFNLGNDGKATSTVKSLGGKLGIYDNSQASTTPGAILSIHANTTTPAFLLNQAGAGDIFTLQDNGITGLILRDGALLGIATSTPTVRFESAGDGLFKGGLYVQATSTLSSLIATSTLEIRSVANAYSAGTLFNAFKDKIGLATATPGSLLSVHGNANIGELTVEGLFKSGTVNATSTVITAAGTAAAPTYSTLGDSDTGLFFPAANMLAVSTGGTERFRFDSTGNVGLARSSPSTAFQVVGDGTFGFASLGTGLGDLNILGSDINLGNDGKATSTITSLGGRLSIYDNAQASTSPGAILSIHAASTTAGAMLINQTAAGPIFTVQDNGATIFDVRDGGNVIVNSGNVGIGTTNPTNILDVYKSSSGATITGLRIQNPNSAASTGAAIDFTLSSSDVVMGRINTIRTNVDGRTQMAFSTYTSGGSLSEVMRLDNAGNVGISTVAPKTALHVVGDGTFNFSAIGDGLGDINALGGNFNLGNDGKATSTITSLGGRLSIYDNAQASTSPGAILSIHAASTTAGAMLINQTSAGPIFTVQDNGATIFDVRDGGNVIVNSGNVGIGTTNPTYTLEIGGSHTTPAAVNKGLMLIGGTITPGTAGQDVYGLETAFTAGSGSGNINGAVNFMASPMTKGTSGTIAIRAGLFVQDLAAAATNAYGVYIVTQTGGTTGNYSLYSAGGTNYFGGNVGIGTTEPGTKLEVSQTATTLANLKANVANNALSFVSATGAGTSYAPGISWRMSDQNPTLNNAGIFAQFAGSGSYLHFGTSNNYALGITNDAMVIDYSGNVGIGTTNPGNRFQVTATPAADSVITYIQHGTAAAAQNRALVDIGRSGQDYLYLGGDSSENGIITVPSGALVLATTVSFTPRMTILNGGNVGIGTTNPGAKLDVQATQATVNVQSTTGTNSAYQKFTNTGGSGYIGINNDTGASLVGSGGLAYNTVLTGPGSDSYGIQFSTGASNVARMTITGTGNVGIGTTSPAALFSVGGAGYFTGNVGIGIAAPGTILDIRAASASEQLLSTTVTNTVYTAWRNETSNNGHLYVGKENSAGGTIITGTTAYAGVVGLYGSTAPLQFATNNAVAMTILNGGNVGIGTTNPVAQLYIYGTAASQSSIGQVIRNTSSTGYSSYSLTEDGGANGATIQYINSAFDAGTRNNNLEIFNQSASGKITFHTANNTTPKMTILSGGNVGIGTTVPQRTLDVAGNLALSGDGAHEIIGYGATTLTIGDNNDNIQIGDTATGYIYRATTGNVGIGTTGPSTNLGIAGSLSNTNNFNTSKYLTGLSIVNRASTNSAASIHMEGNITTAQSPDWTNIISFRNTASTDTANDNMLGLIGLQTETNANGGKMFFLTHDTSTTLTTRMVINSSGNVGIGNPSPSSQFEVGLGVEFDGIANGAGTAYLCQTLATAVVSTSTSACNGSSIRFKDNVQNLSKGINEVMKLRPISFTYKPELLEGTSPRIGFIAEEMVNVVPEVVGYDKDGLPSNIDYATLTSLLTKSIQQIEGVVNTVNAPTSTPSLVIDAVGNVGIGSTTPSYKLAVAGDVAATAFINISTSASKKNIEYLGESDEKDILGKIREVQVATYNYKFENDCTGADSSASISGNDQRQSACRRRLGLIAEEAPAEVLSIDGKGVDIYKLSSFILAGVKAQQMQIDQLTSRVSALESASPISPIGPIGPISTALKAVMTVAKSVLATITSAMADWANAALAETTKLIKKSETETEINYETYGVTSSREEIIASGSAVLTRINADSSAQISADSSSAYIGVRIKFDASFIAATSETEPIKVILTPTTRLNGALYVAAKSRFGFEAREINAQDEGGMFDWMVIARKRGSTQIDTQINAENPVSPIGPIGPMAPAQEEPVVTPAPDAATTTTPEIVIPPVLPEPTSTTETAPPPAETPPSTEATTTP